jgi:SAM-dependent methyltransferase
VTSDPLSDAVSSQYQRWRYPEPIVDLPAWLENNWQWFDPSHSHRMFWPERDQVNGLDILVAGCGTNQAAVLAYTNPGARILAIDVSEPSLDHHRDLKRKYALENLELRLLPIEQAQSLGREFDLIISTGVLHHMADPAAGMSALAGCLRVDGVAAIMLYAHYGRIGVEMLQGVFKEMGLGQDEASVAVVREVLASLPQDHPVQSYLAIAPDLGSDAGLVDTFLHGRERSYTVDQCRELVESAGLVFNDWFLKAPYYPPVSPSNAFEASLAALPAGKQWSVIERINTSNGCHFFTACRADRPERSYRIDFAAERFLDYVPSLRYRCELDGARISRHDWSAPVDQTQLALLRLVDGHRTIGEILGEPTIREALAQLDAEAQRDYARALFQSLWQFDLLAVGLRASPSD